LTHTSGWGGAYSHGVDGKVDGGRLDARSYDFRLQTPVAPFPVSEGAISGELGNYKPEYICCASAYWNSLARYPPANGREFVADDVVFHFNRLFGLGGGFTKPSPHNAAINAFQDMVSVTASDKYTIVLSLGYQTPRS